MFGNELAVFVVDTERLWHFSVGELAWRVAGAEHRTRRAKPRVVEHLAAVVRWPVKVYTGSGLAYLVRLKPAPPAQADRPGPIPAAGRRVCDRPGPGA